MCERIFGTVPQRPFDGLRTSPAWHAARHTDEDLTIWIPIR